MFIPTNSRIAPRQIANNKAVYQDNSNLNTPKGYNKITKNANSNIASINWSVTLIGVFQKFFSINL